MSTQVHVHVHVLRGALGDGEAAGASMSMSTPVPTQARRSDARGALVAARGWTDGSGEEHMLIVDCCLPIADWRRWPRADGPTAQARSR